MSWIKENYEKAALGGAAVIALGVGALILTGSAGEVKEEQNPARVNTFDVPEQVPLDGYVKALDKTGEESYAQHLESNVYSFIAFPVYGVKGTPGIDELGPERLFHGIPLKWWKEHNLKGYQFSGGGEKDTDEDGFNQKEEYEAKTDPTKLSSRPDLLKKLQLLDSTKKRYRIQWSRVDDDRANMTFTLRKTTYDICRVGDTFPASGQPEEFLNRFKVKSKGMGPNPTTNSEEEFYEIEDTQKDIPPYKMWRSDGPRKFIDWIAKFKLNTPDGGEAFIVPEGGEFSLPYKKGAKGYKFELDQKRDPKQDKIQNLNIKGANGVVPLGLAPKEEKEPEGDGQL